ncbi:MAG: PIG-L deacetylase family protein [Candidatus Woesearchaeota archaeon]
MEDQNSNNRNIKTFENEAVKETDKSIIVFGAHSDDQVFGAGGTIAKYHQLGYTVIAIIMTHGEKSHPWLRKEPLAKIRMSESHKAAKILGIKKTIFYDFDEDRILVSYQEDASLQEELEKTIAYYRPLKIFVHSDEDSHPSHRQVNQVAREAYNNAREKDREWKSEIYTYDIWTIAHFKRRARTWVYIDVTKHHEKKIKALKVFKSQKIALYTLWLSVYAKAFVYGLMSRYKYAERFSKENWDN